MPELPRENRDLDFLGLLAELHALVDRRVRVDASAMGRPLFVSAAGALAHLLDLRSPHEVPGGGSLRVAFGLEPGGLSFTLSAREVVSARAWTAPGDADGPPRREIQIHLVGGGELLVGEDLGRGCRSD